MVGNELGLRPVEPLINDERIGDCAGLNRLRPATNLCATFMRAPFTAPWTCKSLSE